MTVFYELLIIAVFLLGRSFIDRAAILDRFFVKAMSYEMEHSFLRNDLD